MLPFISQVFSVGFGTLKLLFCYSPNLSLQKQKCKWMQDVAGTLFQVLEENFGVYHVEGTWVITSSVW